MGIRVALNHVTKYTYDRPVSLLPRTSCGSALPLHARTPGFRVIHFRSSRPRTAPLNWQQDPYRQLPRPARLPETRLGAGRHRRSPIADLTPINPFELLRRGTRRAYPFKYDPTLARELVPYLETLRPARVCAKVDCRACGEAASKLTTFWSGLNRAHPEGSGVRPIPDGTGSARRPKKRSELARGSCRDSRVVVGTTRPTPRARGSVRLRYLPIQLVADEEALEGPAGPTANFTDLHAWAEVYVPGARVGRSRPDLGADGRGGAHPARPAPPTRDRRLRFNRIVLLGQARRRRQGGGGFPVPHVGYANRRSPARDEAVHRNRGGRKSISTAASRQPHRPRLARSRTCG